MSLFGTKEFGKSSNLGIAVPAMPKDGTSRKDEARAQTRLDGGGGRKAYVAAGAATAAAVAAAAAAVAAAVAAVAAAALLPLLLLLLLLPQIAANNYVFSAIHRGFIVRSTRLAST